MQKRFEIDTMDQSTYCILLNVTASCNLGVDQFNAPLESGLIRSRKWYELYNENTYICSVVRAKTIIRIRLEPLEPGTYKPTGVPYRHATRKESSIRFLETPLSTRVTSMIGMS